MTDLLTNYDVDENGVALLQLDRPDSRNAMNTAMLEELLGHIASAREDEQVRVLVVSSTDHMGLSAGADVREDLDRDGAIRRMQLFADLYDQLVAFPKPTIAACHGAVRRRRRRGRGRLRSTRRRLEPAPPLPRRRARRPGRPRAAGHALRPLGRQVPADHVEGDRRRRGASLGPRPQGRSRGTDRGGGAPARRPGRDAPAGVGRPDQVDAPRVGRHRGSLPRRGRGPGRLAVRGQGPRLPGLARRRAAPATFDA